MGKLPQRLKFAAWYRSVYQKLEPKMWIPNVNPSVYQVMAIVLSFVFLFVDGRLSRFILVAIILLLDWWDGATARRYGLASEMGYMVDVAVDRLSELIMFFPLFGGAGATLWFAFSLLNLAMSFLGYKTGKHMIMPLRFLYLFYIWI